MLLVLRFCAVALKAIFLICFEISVKNQGINFKRFKNKNINGIGHDAEMHNWGDKTVIFKLESKINILTVSKKQKHYV